ncbi:hypothetical protein pb186bvf_004517 [Paramecium bursaria]
MSSVGKQSSENSSPQRYLIMAVLPTLELPTNATFYCYSIQQQQNFFQLITWRQWIAIIYNFLQNIKVIQMANDFKFTKICI